MRYQVERVIYEIVKKKPYPTVREIVITLEPRDIILAGVHPDDEDNNDEIYGHYELTLDQIEKIKEFMKADFSVDYDKYLYVLGCYQKG